MNCGEQFIENQAFDFASFIDRPERKENFVRVERMVCTSSCVNLPISKRSSANREQVIGLADLANFNSLIPTDFILILSILTSGSIAIINKYGDIAQPCRNPFVGRKNLSPELFNCIVNFADVMHACIH